MEDHVNKTSETFRTQVEKKIREKLTSSILTQDEMAEALEAMCDIYISAHLIDVKHDTYKTIKSNRFIEIYENSVDGGTGTKLKHVVRNLAVDEFRDLAADFVDTATLSTRMRDLHSISCVFISKISGWCRARFIDIRRDKDGNVETALFTVMGIDAEKRKEDRLLLMAQTDLMTGIMNRGSGQRAISNLLEEGTEGMFCMFDVDEFKHFNDTYGHDMGDKVLISIAKVMEKVFRGGDVVTRLGGDEFAFFARGVSDEIIGQVIINRLLRAISEINLRGLEGEGICISMGVVFAKRGDTFDEVYRQADQCVYISKKTKGSVYTVYQGDNN